MRKTLAARKRIAPGLLAGAVLAAVTLGGATSLVQAQDGVGGINVVRLTGLMKTADSAQGIAQLTLVVSGKPIAFSVKEVRRMTGAGEGRALLNPLGPGASPELRVVGKDEDLDRISAAAAGSQLTLTGILSYEPPYLQLTSLDEAPPASKPKPKAKAKTKTKTEKE
jgi:hypothetical protein